MDAPPDFLEKDDRIMNFFFTNCKKRDIIYLRQYCVPEK